MVDMCFLLIITSLRREAQSRQGRPGMSVNAGQLTPTNYGKASNYE